MFKIRVIKNTDDYTEALATIQELMLKDPSANSEEGEKISVLTTLIKDYENKTFPESLPDPIDAIVFRMEQQDLKPKDLIPFIGSRGKVSEVLSRKKPLSLSMIRSLEIGLGIPAKVLVQEIDDFKDIKNINWSRFPLKEMAKRGYFPEKLQKIKDLEATMKDFFAPVGELNLMFGMLRKTTYRSTRPMDKYALTAWAANVVKKSKKDKSETEYKEGTTNLDFMQHIAKFSREENGPILAKEFLKKHGVTLIIEPIFPQTYLDGAMIVVNKKNPVIGLTLRHDRLDNFWFSLMHELAHLALHFNKNINFFYDNLDNSDSTNVQETEADELAREALVPESKWEISPAKVFPSFMAAKSLAKDLGIHIAIVAGKMRYEGGKYTYLNKIITQEKVRIYFPEEQWN